MCFYVPPPVCPPTFLFALNNCSNDGHSCGDGAIRAAGSTGWDFKHGQKMVFGPSTENGKKNVFEQF